MTSGNVAAFTAGHEGSPTASDEGARARTRHVWRGINAAAPIRRDEILVRPQLAGAIQHAGVPLGREAVLVRITADARHTLEAEVESRCVEAGFGEEGHEKGAEAAIHVQGELLAESELG